MDSLKLKVVVVDHVHPLVLIVSRKEFVAKVNIQIVCGSSNQASEKKRKKKEIQNQIQSTSDSLRNSTKDGGSNQIAAKTFTFSELAAAARNFRRDCLIGEGGFGRVYKGRLGRSNQVVAIKQLDRSGLQGNHEFLVEVLMLSLLHHTNLVNLIGYCADGDQRLLVYEYMPLGSLEDHLHDPIPGKKAIENSKTGGEQNLVAWARPLFKDKRKFSQIADPMLQGQYPTRGLFQALSIAAMCVKDQPDMRPAIADVVTALTYLASQKYDPTTQPIQDSRWAPPTPPRTKRDGNERQSGGTRFEREHTKRSL
ncbi:unnamed protein product [Fraxinus pennsylvanica]|uniref:non-specific serine/threonine protein kinase n=1 Tax=Fraxinus pennsylvanica TaxID=56036 RepID=A0AAD1ZDZ3_9LAMI|nr:unnamed protein product [Fraxinus pennsylvanica]